MSLLHHYINAFSSLHTAPVLSIVEGKGYKAPHKAILLLSIIDLVEEGSIASPHIRLTDALEKKFHEVWHRYLGTSAVFTPDIAKPYTSTGSAQASTCSMSHSGGWWSMRKLVT